MGGQQCSEYAWDWSPSLGGDGPPTTRTLEAAGRMRSEPWNSTVRLERGTPQSWACQRRAKKHSFRCILTVFTWHRRSSPRATLSLREVLGIKDLRVVAGVGFEPTAFRL